MRKKIAGTNCKGKTGAEKSCERKRVLLLLHEFTRLASICWQKWEDTGVEHGVSSIMQGAYAWSTIYLLDF